MKWGIPWCLVLVTVAAFFVRAYTVASIPPSLSWDEVSIGYNAYSILKTGRDEHGRFLPIDTFIAYGDYKPPLAIYLTVPFVALFGLTELAVRLPSVVAGTLAVLLTYFVVLELFGYREREFSFGIWHFAFGIPATAALLLAVSPWHIQLSRAGWEANIALTILLLGIWLVLKARKNPRLLIICWIPFGLAMYTFNSARYAAPLLALLFSWRIRGTIRAHPRYALIGVLVAALTLTPLAPHLLSREARLRFTEVNIFSDITVIEKSNDRIAFDRGSLLAKVLHNRRVGFAIEYLKHVFDHFEPWFLFIRGDGNPKFSLQDVGELYVVEAPLLVYGFYRLLIADASLAWTLILWIVFSILPAATARETPHALRIENSLPVWQIFIAYGMASLVKRKKLFLASCFLFLASFSSFWHNYFNHYAEEFAGEWQYGYRQAVQEMRQREDSYDRIVISEAYGRSYMYTLFYTRTDPSGYVATKRSTFDAAGFYHVFGFGKYEFRENGVGSIEPGTLYVATPKEAPEKVRVHAVVRRPNGEPAFLVFDQP